MSEEQTPFQGETPTAQPQHTPGPWRPGKNGGCVVANHPVPEIGGSDAVDYYGGHLIAESIAPQNVPLIAAAPELLEALETLLEEIEFEIEQRQDRGNAEDWVELEEKALAARTAIAKARGGAA